MPDEPTPRKLSYRLETTVRIATTLNGQPSMLRRALLIKASDDPLELMDLARELVRLRLVNGITLVPIFTPALDTTDTDEDVLATWVQLAAEALKDGGGMGQRLMEE